MSKFFIGLIAVLAVPFSASSQDILYTLRVDTFPAKLLSYDVDADDFLPEKAVNYDFRNSGTDLTYFDNSVYALKINTSGTPSPKLVKINPTTGAATAVNVRVNGNISDDVNWTTSTEGLAHDGTNMAIVFADTGRFTYTGGQRSNFIAHISSSGELHYLEDLETNINNSQYVDFDGAGNCGKNFVGMDRNNNNPSLVNIYDTGEFLDYPNNLEYTLINSFTSANNTGNIVNDIDYLSDSRIVLVGNRTGNTGDKGFHFHSNGGSFQNSKTFSNQSADYQGVASTGSSSCTDPSGTTTPQINSTDDFLCYDLMDHERDTYRKEVSILDQFGKSKDVVGHAVKLCNPVGVNKPDFNTKAAKDHLVCYEISDRQNDPQDEHFVGIKNELEDNKLVTGDKDMLCMVSTKEHLRQKAPQRR